MKFLSSEQILHKSTKIVGEVTFKGNLRIDGQIEGSVHLDTTAKVSVSKDALVIVKTLSAGELNIYGTVQAENINAAVLILHSGCIVKGILNVGSIQIESGARYEGLLNVKEPEKKEPVIGSASIAKERLLEQV